MTILLLGQYLDFFSISKFLQLFTSSPWLCIFLLLAVFKGLKICVHTISYYLWTHPAKAPHNPTITPADVTVIIPTVGEFGQEFADTVESILRNTPARIIISTVGPRMKRKAEEACLNIVGDKNIEVICVEQPDKRIQLLTGVQAVRTIVTVYADDHVIWPTTFLRSALAPFEDPIVGLVGTSKRVIRNHNLPFWDNFFNYIACIYLERHNFECTATYNIDGGVFVVSGRTALARTSVLHSLEYRSEFQSEFFTSVGPMKVDDDNFNTRFMVRHGYKIVFHNDPYATIETTLVHETGKLGKFRGQLLRWSRTTWRSNLKSLITDHMCYQTTPWTTYAMFISSFVNFALVYDAALYFTLKWSGSGHMCSFFLLLVLSKLIKPLPHLLRESGDWKWVTFGILFGYFHSFIKLYSMFTIGNIDWTGRQGIQARGSK
ncbi:glycosyltransferase family 2 protein [Stipitochalara longipes BDJ]|nr:glycosyltransferase family 2 protein [Stipitochalara longipes BDJ]